MDSGADKGLLMTPDTESRLYIESKGLPADEILLVSFCPVGKFHKTAYENEEYLIVGNEDEGECDIGVNRHGNVYCIGLGEKTYVAASLAKFAKQLLAFKSFKQSVENCGGESLKKRVNGFRETVTGIDKTATKNSATFWSKILENIDGALEIPIGTFGGDRQIFTIDGRKFSTLKGFFIEAGKVFTLNLSWELGKDFNVFTDILRGGFGRHYYGEPILIKWLHYEKSQRNLGVETMEHITKLILDKNNADCILEKL